MSERPPDNDRLSAIRIPDNASLRDALIAIDNGGIEIALVVSADERLLGTVTDGDVRRALLEDAALSDQVRPYLAPNPVVVTSDVSRADVLDLMRARVLSQIPITDSDGRLVGIHVLQEVLGRVQRPNWAVIMAGGRGTRLGNLTDTTPKPMIPVAGRPILERIVLHLVGSGIRTIFISVNYMSEVIEDHFGDGEAFGCRVHYLREQEPLGTGGSLGLLGEGGHVSSAPVLVMNGDLIVDFSVDGLLAAHQSSGAIATLAVRDYSHSVPFGVISAVDDRLVKLDEKPLHTWLVNAGIYVLEPELIERVPARTPLAVTALLQAALDSGDPVACWRTSSEWHDVGRPSDLQRARGEHL